MDTILKNKNLQSNCSSFFSFHFLCQKPKELECIHTKQTQRVVDSKPGYLLVLSTNHYWSYASDTPRGADIRGNIRDHHWSSDGMSGGDELENWNSQISIEYHPKIHQKIRCLELFVLFFPLIHVKLHPFENPQQQKTLICLLRCF